MAEAQNEDRVPVICLDPCTLWAFEIFNPNEWSAASRTLIQSCAAWYSVVRYNVDQIARLCAHGRARCRPHFQSFCAHTKRAPDVLPKVTVYGEVPELHTLVVAYFAAIKGLLDLMTQLLVAEKIIDVRLDAFRSAKQSGRKTVGGRVLNALKRNAVKGKDIIARRLGNLIVEHKGLWIDQLVSVRDELVHPEKGAKQLMFCLQIESTGGELLYRGALPPSIRGEFVDTYTRERLRSMEEFAKSFLGLLASSQTRGGSTDA